MGVVGSGIVSAFGGWDIGFITLISFMAIDFVTGLIVAGVFKNSQKSKTGGVKSSIGVQGLFRKGMMLTYVLMAQMLDLYTGSSFIRDAVIIGFVTNEFISITENAGLMGLPLPAAIQNALDILKQKAEKGIDKHE